MNQKLFRLTTLAAACALVACTQTAPLPPPPVPGPAESTAAPIAANPPAQAATSAPAATKPGPIATAAPAPAPGASAAPTPAAATAAPAGARTAPGDLENLVDDGRLVRIGRGALNDMQASSDGTTVALATSLGVQVYDAATLKLVRAFPSPAGAVTVAFSPDHRFVATNDDDPNVTIYDITSGESRKLTGTGVAITGMSYSRNGARLAVGRADSVFNVYDVASGNVLLTASALNTAESGNVASSMRLAMSADGKRAFTTSFSNVIGVWDVDSKARVQTLAGHTGLLSEIVASNDGKFIASCGDDGTVRIWDAASGKLQRTLTGHNVPISTLAFSPDGSRLVSGDTENTIKVWQVSDGKLLNTLADARYIRALAMSADGSQVFSANAGTFAEYAADDGSLVRQLIGFANAPANVQISPDGATLAFSDDEDVVMIQGWRTPAPQRQALIGHVSPVQSIAFSPDSKRLLSGSLDDAVLAWDLKDTAAQPARLAGATGTVGSVMFGPDGNQAFAASLDRLVGWDLASGKVIRNIEHKTTEVSVVLLSPSRTTYALAGANNVFVADATTGALKRTTKGQNDNFYALAFSRDGKRIAAVSEVGSVRIFDADSGALAATVQGTGSPLLVAAFSPDGAQLATGGDDHAVRLWDLASGKQIKALTGHTNDVLGLAFAADGSTLVSSSADGTLRIWALK